MRLQLLLQVLLVGVGISVAELLREAPEPTLLGQDDTAPTFAPSYESAAPDTPPQLTASPATTPAPASAKETARLVALERAVADLTRRLEARVDDNLPAPKQLTALLAPGVDPEQVTQFRALQRASERLAHVELLEHRTGEALDSLSLSLSEDERSAVLFATGRAWGRLLEAFESERANPTDLATRKASYESMRSDFRAAIARAASDAEADRITERLAQEIGLTSGRFVDHDSDGQ